MKIKKLKKIIRKHKHKLLVYQILNLKTDNPLLNITFKQRKYSIQNWTFKIIGTTDYKLIEFLNSIYRKVERIRLGLELNDKEIDQEILKKQKKDLELRKEIEKQFLIQQEREQEYFRQQGY